MKIKKLIGAVAIVSIALPIIPAGASNISKYNAWKSRSLHTVTKTVNDTVKFVIDLNNKNANAVVHDLRVLGIDASAFVQIANSPDTTLNLDIEQYSYDLSSFANEGLAIMNGGGNSITFGNYERKVSHDETVVGNRLKYDNSRW